MGTERYPLLLTALKHKEQFVLHHFRHVAVSLKRGELNKHTQTVTATHFEVLCLRPIGIVEILSIDIHPEASLVATHQTCLVDTQRLVVAVIHHKRICR